MVVVKLVRGHTLLASPEIEVPMRTTVAVTPGPTQVVVGGVPRLTGVALAGQTLSGSMGQGCPQA
jgi:hypothetical protein